MTRSHAASPDTAVGSALADSTLIFIAPRTGTNGVSDYSDDLIALARPRVKQLIGVRHGGAASASLLDVLRARRVIRRAVRRAEGPVILHAEQSGGVLVPFWGMLRMPATVRSATVHDAPLSVWLPFLTPLTVRSWTLVHAIHYPTLPLIHLLERTVMKGATLFVLTRSGAEESRRWMRHSKVLETFHPIPAKPAVTPAGERPLAVGLFGYVYRGKGFEHLDELRKQLDDRIAIRVAGRGTEKIAASDGITVLGPVEGDDEDDFFASVRVLALPYGKRSSYGPETHVASGTMARATAYDTPVVAMRFEGVEEYATVVDSVEQLARSIEAIIFSDSRIAEASEKVAEVRRGRTPAAAFERYEAEWQRALEEGLPTAS